MMLKVMTVVGTRPEIIKLAMVIPELEKYVEHILVHTGQNYDYELNQIFFEEFGIRKPDVFLNAVGDSTARTIGNIIAESDRVMEELRPDALLVYGDTNSCLCVISAKRRKIPVFHMEAGNRCFDERVPEEINRRIIDHIADINMTLTEHARRYLLSEGVRPETIFNIGSSMKEVISKYKDKIESSTVLDRLCIKSGNYLVISAHREENIDDQVNFSNLVASLNLLATHFNFPLIFSTHPRTMKKIEKNAIQFDPLVKIMKPLGFFDYMHLQKNAYCVVSDSGTITEEASILGFPAVTIRNAHERPEGMDVGTLIMAGLIPESVLNAVQVVTEQNSQEYRPEIVPDYDVDDPSKKVVRIIISYIRYVNATVWRK